MDLHVGLQSVQLVDEYCTSPKDDNDVIKL